LVNDLGRAQEKKFATNQRYKKQLSEKLRAERQRLEALLAASTGKSDFHAQVHSALALFAVRLETIHAELEQARQAGKLTRSVTELAGSYVHLHLNRLFRSAANAQEMVLYDFLARTYDSQMARERK
jgi:thiopeptide-type bacteriocin biosynthesis protein